MDTNKILVVVLKINIVRPLNSISNSCSINSASHFGSLSLKSQQRRQEQSQEQRKHQLPEVPSQREKRTGNGCRGSFLFSLKITVNIASSPSCPSSQLPPGLLDGERRSNTKCICSLSSWLWDVPRGRDPHQSPFIEARIEEFHGCGFEISSPAFSRAALSRESRR